MRFPKIILLSSLTLSAYASFIVPNYKTQFNTARHTKSFVRDTIIRKDGSLKMAADPTDLAASAVSLSNLPLLFAPLAALAAGFSAVKERERIENEIATTENELEIIKLRLKSSELQINVSVCPFNKLFKLILILLNLIFIPII